MTYCRQALHSHWGVHNPKGSENVAPLLADGCLFHARESSQPELGCPSWLRAHAWVSRVNDTILWPPPQWHDRFALVVRRSRGQRVARPDSRSAPGAGRGIAPKEGSRRPPLVGRPASQCGNRAPRPGARSSLRDRGFEGSLQSASDFDAIELRVFARPGCDLTRQVELSPAPSRQAGETAVIGPVWIRQPG